MNIPQQLSGCSYEDFKEFMSPEERIKYMQAITRIRIKESEQSRMKHFYKKYSKVLKGYQLGIGDIEDEDWRDREDQEKETSRIIHENAALANQAERNYDHQ